MPLDENTSLRADARRSHSAIIHAAAELFALQGIAVGFKEIARAAGVGVGTVYRRFPTKEDLLKELFQEKLERNADRIEAAASIEDPLVALEAICKTSIESQRGDRGLIQVLARDIRAFSPTQDRAHLAIHEVLTRAQQAGIVRPDVTAIDIRITLVSLAQVAVFGDDSAWRRQLALFLCGITNDTSTTHFLPGEPPTTAVFDRIARGDHRDSGA